MSAVIQNVSDEQDTRAALRFVTCGSVDDGKSTLFGRLLVDSKTVLQDQLAGVQRGGQTDLALLTDGLQAEREQGITIDVAYRYFNTLDNPPPNFLKNYFQNYVKDEYVGCNGY